MKFLHISDLHIGKRIYEKSMLEDQAYILDQILLIVDREKPEGVLIAGDVYDKSVPLERGVTLFDDFLSKLHDKAVKVFIISGNHDSGERLGFGSHILEKREIYVSGRYQGALKKVALEDEFGEVNVYLLPFIKPAHVKCLDLADQSSAEKSYDEAVAAVIGNEQIDDQVRNVLVAHQFVVGSEAPKTCDSEQMNVGGVDWVAASHFDAFDYVALGHLHGPQKVGRETIRYSGSPLKYSFSEVNHKKSAVLIELGKKGEVKIQLIPLVPQRDFRAIKGPLEALTSKENYERADKDDYLRVTLTDDEELFAPMDSLSRIYSHILRLDFENRRTMQTSVSEVSVDELDRHSPMSLFQEFYKRQNNEELDMAKEEVLKEVLAEVHIL